MIVIIAVLIVSIIILFWLLERAPVGYEDETGFHYGEPEDRNG